MRNGSRGFSLLEVLVATALVVVALAGLAQVFVIAMSTARGSKVRTVATIAALEKLDELLAFDGEPDEGADFIDAVGRRLGGGATAPPGTAYVRRWSAERRPPPGSGEVVLQVSVEFATGGEAARLVGLKPRRMP